MSLQTMHAHMNTATPGTKAKSCLVEIIELKWLLTGHGVHVHVERLQSDAEYARRTLDRADALPNAALREAAARLRLCLGV
jgi:predicted metal-dependent phosphoesterase TrpH